MERKIKRVFEPYPGAFDHLVECCVCQALVNEDEKVTVDGVPMHDDCAKHYTGEEQ